MVIKTAIVVDESIVVVTTMGIDLINSPMMPVDKSSGTKAQIVVIVVDHRGTMKSRQTTTPVSYGVKLPVRWYLVMAATVTIVSSIKSPKDSKNENVVRKLSVRPSALMIAKEARKVRGTVIDAMIACLRPKKTNKRINTRMTVV